MKSVYLIIMALAVTALAQDSAGCSFSSSSEAQWCSVAVGQVLSFHLTNTTNRKIRLKKDNQSIILRIEKNEIKTLDEEFANHAELFPNGTLTLGKAMKKHSGDYLLEEYFLNGTSLRKEIVHLKIQVSKPDVSQVCLSSDQMNISCSSEGEEAEIILTLYDVLLVLTTDQSRLLNNRKVDRPPSWTKSNKRCLHGELAGKLKCRVWNNVRKEETVIHLNSWKESFPVVAVSVGSSTVLLLVALGCGLFIVRQKQTPTAVTEDVDRVEILYSRVERNKGGTTEPVSHQISASESITHQAVM